MNEVLSIAPSLVGGFGTGILFFGGLWLTVRHLDKMRNPALVITLSSIARTALALGAIWGLSRGDLLQLALCLTGFLTARFVLLKRIRAATPSPAPNPPEEKESCT